MALTDRMQEREIDGIVYRAWPVPFGKGRPALVRLLRVAAPMLGAAATKDMGRILEALPPLLDDAELSFFAKLMGEASCYVDDDRTPPLIESQHAAHFESDYLRYFRWLAFCLEVNFAGFFSGAKAELTAMAVGKTTTAGSTAGNGSPGASSSTTL